MKHNVIVLTVVVSFAVALLGTQIMAQPEAQAGEITVVPPPTLTVVPVTPTESAVFTSTTVLPTMTLTAIPITGTPTVGVTVVPTPTLENKIVGVSFVPAANTVRVGEVFTKTIRLHEISNVGPVSVDSARVSVRFDPHHLQVVRILPGEAMTTTEISFDNEGGSFTYGAEGEVVLGNINLFTVELKALAVTNEPPFEATTLYTSDVEISYRGSPVMTISVMDIVHIVGGPPPWCVYLPIVVREN